MTKKKLLILYFDFEKGEAPETVLYWVDEDQTEEITNLAALAKQEWYAGKGSEFFAFDEYFEYRMKQAGHYFDQFTDGHELVYMDWSDFVSETPSKSGLDVREPLCPVCGKPEYLGNVETGQFVCQSCGHVMTADDKKAILESK